MSNREHEPQHAEDDPFWSADIPLFEGTFRYDRTRPVPVRARVHISEERYRAGDVRDEIVPLTHRAGPRTYVLMKPYVPEPDTTVSVGLYPREAPGGAIGEVLSVTQRGTYRREIGHAQAWHYPLDHTLLPWECFLDAPFRDRPLPEDPNMQRLWLATERWLVARFPTSSRIVTTARDPLFDEGEYQTFLHSLGYAPVTKAGYGKEVPH